MKLDFLCGMLVGSEFGISSMNLCSTSLGSTLGVGNPGDPLVPLQDYLNTKGYLKIVFLMMCIQLWSQFPHLIMATSSMSHAPCHKAWTTWDNKSSPVTSKSVQIVLLLYSLYTLERNVQRSNTRTWDECKIKITINTLDSACWIDNMVTELCVDKLVQQLSVNYCRSSSNIVLKAAEIKLKCPILAL